MNPIETLEENQKHLPENLKVKYFDLSKPSFMINGKRYYYQAQLKTRRQLMFDKLSNVVGFNADFEYSYNVIKGAHSTLTSSNNIPQGMINAANILWDGLQTISDKKKWDNDDLVPYVYQIASLILVREDENTTQISDIITSKKYEDFKDSDYSYNAFFLLALSHIAGYAKISEEINHMHQMMNSVLDLKEPQDSD